MGVTVQGSKMFPSPTVTQSIDQYAFTGFLADARPVGISRLNTDESPSTAS